MSGTAEHPRLRLNEVIHQSVRFSIMAALAGAESMAFKDIRDTVQVSDSVLSKQLSLLEQAGYVSIKKTFAGKVPRTSAKLSTDGRRAWLQHLDTLREISGG